MDIIIAAAQEVFEPFRLLMLVCGVFAGLILGVIPGLGGLFGLAVLIPMTYHLDPYAAFALLLGMGSVTTTSDTIPAVLLGVPGTVGSAATVVDGHPMAKNNQAARAFGAAYSASVLGGLFGAFVLAMAIPVMRPVVLLLDTTDFLAITIFGLSVVALLSGPEPTKGFAAAIVGICLSFVGIDAHESVERWTFGSIELWDGLPLIAVFLGLFGIPELASLLTRGRIATSSTLPETREILLGVKDTLREWKLVLQCSSIGSFLGAVPGVGLSVIDWIAYGHATKKTRPNLPPYGEGNIRGVIAPESANNAKEGGALIPTIAFGVPGSASMSLLLGAFLIQGLVPGPDMLGKDASITVSMIFSIAIANIVGAGICLVSTKQLARIALVPAVTLVPVALTFVVLGAFNSGKSLYDFSFLLAFGVAGLLMKHLNWPRAAFALGFVLGPNFERFFFISYQIEGWGFVYQPSILILAAFAIFSVVKKAISWRKAREYVVRNRHQKLDVIVLLVVMLFGAYVCVSASAFPFAASIFPMISGAILCLTILANLLARLLSTNSIRFVRNEQLLSTPRIVGSLWNDMRIIVLVALLSSMIIGFGHILGPVIFVFVWRSYLDRSRISKNVLVAVIVGAIIYSIFDILIAQTWPASLVYLLYDGFIEAFAS